MSKTQNLQQWMKKEGVFDKDIYRELDAKGVKDPEYDFSKISKAEWNKFKKEMVQQRKQDIKDNAAIRKMEQKLAKIGKKWKTQQGKKFKDTASITKKPDNDDIEKKSNLSPNKAKKKKGKKGGKKKGGKSKKDSMNPSQIKSIILYWLRESSIDRNEIKYKNIELYLMVCKYCPLSSLFGSGDDGTLTIKANKVHTLRSDQLYEFESIVLKKKATLTVDVWKTKSDLQDYKKLDGYGGKLLLKVSGNIIMNQGSKITVKACGYPGGFGKCVKGGKGLGVNAAGGEHGEWTSATGGLYTSKGLGDPQMKGELILGSGGGGITSTANRFFPGGIGGGILKIECNKIIFKGEGCVLSASGQTSVHGGGGSGGVLWLRALSIGGKPDMIKQCKIVNRGGKGDGDEYSENKENAEDGRIRIDILNDGDKELIKDNVKCKNVYYGAF